MGFVASSSFIADYIRIVNRDSKEIATWLFANAKFMTEAMFFNPENNWKELRPDNILALRACAPNGVFTTTAKGGYLTKVSGNPELEEITSALFSDDFGFINGLPAKWQDKKAELIILMQLAYGKGIRSADSRVRIS